MAAFPGGFQGRDGIRCALAAGSQRFRGGNAHVGVVIAEGIAERRNGSRSAGGQNAQPLGGCGADLGAPGAERGCLAPGICR